MILLLVCSLPISASASDTQQVLATYSFNSKKVPAQWSTGKTFVIGENRTLGLFNDRNKRYRKSTVLTIDGIPEGREVEVKFDLIFVGTWDSGGKLADRFTISEVDGNQLLEMTEFPCALIDGDESRPLDNNGFVRVGERERAYWIQPLAMNIPLSGIKNGKTAIEFRGYLTGRKTEFWALDNVKIILQ